MKKIAYSIIVSIFLLGNVTTVSALSKDEVLDITSAYRSHISFVVPKIAVPTVVEVPFDREYIERPDFLVLDITTSSFEPSYLRPANSIPEYLYAEVLGARQDASPALVDRDRNTYAEFPASGKLETVAIRVVSQRPIRSSALTLDLPENVALPRTVAIRAVQSGLPSIVVAQQAMSNTTVRFPETFASEWEIVFTYLQPLRIGEIRLENRDVLQSGRALRFLAQPEHEYRIYLNPDRSVDPVMSEAGNYTADKGVLVLSQLMRLTTEENQWHKPADTDGDRIPDVLDNCLASSNPEQTDVNANGLGDVCEDFDRDSISNEKDNCPDIPNVRQLDDDGDSIGNECDEEESRITEKYIWIPWAGLGFAVIVLVVLSVLTAQHLRTTEQKGTEQV
jgi:Thrombospondin type 3 repeat